MIGDHRPGNLVVDSLADRRAWGILNSRVHDAHALLRRGSLWIVPDLWKTHRTRFPQGRWKIAESAVFHTLHKAYWLSDSGEEEKPVR